MKKCKSNLDESNTLTKAVEKKVINKISADVVMEYAVYDRSFSFIAKELGITLIVAQRLYQEAISKLRRWLQTEVIILKGGKIICD